MKKVKSLFPPEVMDDRKFIIEQCIKGDEFAIDAYFNHQGEPVIVGILKHLFSSGADVSDRIYYTSKEVIEKHLEPMAQFLKLVGDRTRLTNFPLHVEVRIDENGVIQPIEVNPMRFGGFCTTADLTSMAYGFNPYEYFFRQQKPQWKTLLNDKNGKHYCLVILDNSTGYEPDQIDSFDYSRLLSKFEHPIELRKMDIHEYPVFGMLFTETRTENYDEIETILKSDLKEFVTLKTNLV